MLGLRVYGAGTVSVGGGGGGGGGLPQYAFDTSKYPHSSTGLMFAYTDFRTAYVNNTNTPSAQAEAQTEQDFIAKHTDMVASGPELLAGGYPVGLIHRPYTFLMFPQSDGTDWGNMLDNDSSDFATYAGANEEQGYLHYVAGANMLHDWLDSISAAGQLLTTYNCSTYADVYHNGETVTVVGAQVAGTSVTVSNIAGAQITTSLVHNFSVGNVVALHAKYHPSYDGQYTVQSVIDSHNFTINVSLGNYQHQGITVGLSSPFNGTSTISGVTVVNGKTTFGLGGASAQGAVNGAVYRTSTGAFAKSERYRFVVVDFPPPRWCINPKSALRRSYEPTRQQNILAGNYTSYVPEAIFIDETAENNIGAPAGTATQEYNPANSTQFYTDMAGLLSTIHAALSGTPFQYQINTGNYASANTSNIEDAAKSAHKEQILDLTTGNWTNYWPNYIAARLAAGDYIELVSPTFPADNVAGGGGNYANDPVPIGCRNAGNVRSYMACFCMSLMVYDPVTYPQQIALNLWNGDWFNAWNDNKGLNNRWAVCLEAPLGHPTGAAVKLVSGGTDPLGQPVTIWGRPFEGGYAIVRVIQGYQGSSSQYGDTSAYSYTMPASTGPTGKWSRVKSDGTLDTPALTFGLRPCEGLALIPA